MSKDGQLSEKERSGQHCNLGLTSDFIECFDFSFIDLRVMVDVEVSWRRACIQLGARLT